MAEREKGRGDRDRTKGGPGLGGTQEGIERSGPPRGMEGGDSGLSGPRPTQEPDVSTSGRKGDPSREPEEKKEQ